MFAGYVWKVLRLIAFLSNPVTPAYSKPPLFLFGFSRWKTFMEQWFPEHTVVFVPAKILSLEFKLKWQRQILKVEGASVMAWQYKGRPGVKELCAANNIPFHYVEDGFLRSVALGALRVTPLSLTFDSQDMYFNASSPSDLEGILLNHDFEEDAALMERARNAIAALMSTRLSKYNSGAKVAARDIYGAKTTKRILVVGQVERDASIKYGCDRTIINNDLVRLARSENPDAQVIYKPHPEVMQGTAEALSNPDEVRGIAQVLDQDISLADAMDTIDHVYTITSLSGFEALLRGIPVTTVGCPFYSGWGLTDDREVNPRRNRTLTVEQVFAAAYILYAQYRSPVTNERIEIEDAISLLYEMKYGRPDAAKA